MTTSRPFDYEGIHHLALVCSDMARTVDFYTNVLGMPLVKTIELPAGMGQHFFFDIGGGDHLAFFWFPDGPGPAPGVASPAARPDNGDLQSAVASMNHVAFHVADDRIEEYRERLLAAGVACSDVVAHDDSEWTVADHMHPGVYLRSVYFQDPDGILLELSSWVRELRPDDVSHAPATGADRTAATTAATAMAASAPPATSAPVAAPVASAAPATSAAVAAPAAPAPAPAGSVAADT